jgi:pyruvate/2-oxoglutarate dehydrogenase complex dihydrolipoamide acyltransferase (E2) component
MAHQVHCPELSDDPDVSGVIATWFAQDQQTVQPGQVIAEIAVDKVTMDIEAPLAGVIHLLVAEESEVTSGQLIAEIH